MLHWEEQYTVVWCQKEAIERYSILYIYKLNILFCCLKIITISITFETACRKCSIWSVSDKICFVCCVSWRSEGGVREQLHRHQRQDWGGNCQQVIITQPRQHHYHPTSSTPLSHNLVNTIITQPRQQHYHSTSSTPLSHNLVNTIITQTSSTPLSHNLVNTMITQPRQYHYHTTSSTTLSRNLVNTITSQPCQHHYHATSSTPLSHNLVNTIITHYHTTSSTPLSRNLINTIITPPR